MSPRARTEYVALWAPWCMPLASSSLENNFAFPSWRQWALAPVHVLVFSAGCTQPAHLRPPAESLAFTRRDRPGSGSGTWLVLTRPCTASLALQKGTSTHTHTLQISVVVTDIDTGNGHRHRHLRPKNQQASSFPFGTWTLPGHLRVTCFQPSPRHKEHTESWQCSQVILFS